MKSKVKVCLCFVSLFVTTIFPACKNSRFDFSLKNTVSIFLLNNGKEFYFCIPIQYMGDYQIEKLDFTGGYINIGSYELLLNKDEVNIYVYLNEEAADDFEISSGGEFKLIYSEKNGRVLISKMDEPLTKKRDFDEKVNHYYFFIEKYLKKEEMKNIINEFKRGNVNSKYFIGYDITIDNELQAGSGMLDDFELSNEPFIDNTVLFPNLNFFRTKYLQK